MIMLILFIILILLILIRLILYLVVKKYGKFSYDGLKVAGFSYNSEKDIFYATKNAWQKNFGYTKYYDLLAPIVMMIIDTEPIKFSYNNKNWLITFWKGQYGIATGGEIGVYCTNQKKIDRNTVYFPVSDSEMLNMDFILYKNGEVITRVHARHWWLAVFKLGMFSNPKELTMDININFWSKEMLNAFLESFKKIGYTTSDFFLVDNTFCFRYIKPRTRKVWTRNLVMDSIRQLFNRKNTELYNLYLDDLVDDNGIDDSKNISNKKLIMVEEFLPDILKNDSMVQKYSEEISKKMFSEKEENVVFLESDISSFVKVK